MKKFLTLLLAACMLFALCACGQQTTTAASTAIAEQTQTAAQDTAATATDPSSVESQLNLIYQNIGVLRADESGRTFWYTVTDLDHNGRLEFIAAITEGTGNYTSAKMYEVNSAYTGLDPISLGLSAGQYLPEIIVNSTDVYKDSANTYNYVYTDTNSEAASSGGHYITKMGISLKNQTLTLTPIAYQDISYVNGYTVYSFFDSTGAEQDAASFDIEAAADNFYSGATKSAVAFDWFGLSDVTNVNRLIQSYNAFIGQAEATALPTQTATPTPTQTIKIVDVTNPKVTKNPTSESLNAGGSCSFVAQAVGYNYMKWQWVSPSGGVYDVATYNPCPSTLITYGATSQTLTLANVPYDMNGWQVQAVFTGDTESVTSGRASLTVAQTPTPVYVTISFSEPYGTTMYNTSTWVSVYSSNGQPIRVECTQSGNSGAYYSETINSGASFPVNGIAGQGVSVYVYASCGDSQANTYYYVDCTPVVPTPEPQSGYTKYGTVSSCDGTWAYITFNDGTSGTYDISYMVSNPPSGGESCCCTFDGYGNLVSFYCDYTEY